MIEKLKKRWNITSNFQVVIILLVFALTGTTAAKLTDPFMNLVNIETNSLPVFLRWIVRIAIILPIYQVLLLLYGWLFGQFAFFWTFEKKFLSRLGLGFLFKKS